MPQPPRDLLELLSLRYFRTALLSSFFLLLLQPIPITAADITRTKGVPVSPTLFPPMPWCIQTYLPVAGDTCWALEHRFGLSHSNFMLINPPLNQAGCNLMQVNSPVCVQVTNMIVSWKSIVTQTVTPTAKKLPPPKTTAEPPKTTPPPPPPPPDDGKTTMYCDKLAASCVCSNDGTCELYHSH